MRGSSILASVVCAMVCCLATTHSTNAQSTTRTFVSSTGNDTNSCARSNPCASFNGALAKTTAGGVVSCVEPSSYGSPIIERAVTIDCDGIGGQVNSGGITINAGANDLIHLRGLTISGVGNLQTSAGISFSSGAGLTVENCTIIDFQAASAIGINFQPSTVATLNVVNSVISGNGNASSGGGIRVAAQPNGFARAALTNVVVAKNYIGVAAVGSGSNSSIEILNSNISHNGSIGAVAVGSGAVIRIGSSQIVGNAAAGTSGNVLSYQNNQIVGNNPDTFPSSAGSLR